MDSGLDFHPPPDLMKNKKIQKSDPIKIPQANHKCCKYFLKFYIELRTVWVLMYYMFCINSLAYSLALTRGFEKKELIYNIFT